MPHIQISAKVIKRQIHGMITLDGCAEHQVIHVVIENADVFRASSFLTNKGQRQYPARWINLPPGMYAIEGLVVDRKGKRVARATTRCSVPL